jgi:uncharacterized protein (DUF1697 family)
MPRFVALYRGINVGGKNPVRMEALRAFHERLGHRAVASYVQSGNVVFEATGTPAGIAKKLSAEFARELGFAPRIMVFAAPRWAQAVRANPYAKFSAKRPTSVHAALCEGSPSAQGLKGLLTKAGGTEEFQIKRGVIYLHAPDGFGASKFAAGIEKACGVPITVRNWRTVEAIGTMLEVDRLSCTPPRTSAGNRKNPAR